jgi:hypothetical protein
MKTHIQIVAALNIAAGAFYLIAAGAIFFFMGLASGIVASQGEHGAAGMVGLVMIALCTFLAVLGLPSVIAGWGAVRRKVLGATGRFGPRRSSPSQRSFRHSPRDLHAMGVVANRARSFCAATIYPTGRVIIPEGESARL